MQADRSLRLVYDNRDAFPAVHHVTVAVAHEKRSSFASTIGSRLAPTTVM